MAFIPIQCKAIFYVASCCFKYSTHLSACKIQMQYTQWQLLTATGYDEYSHYAARRWLLLQFNVKRSLMLHGSRCCLKYSTHYCINICCTMHVKYEANTNTFHHGIPYALLAQIGICWMPVLRCGSCTTYQCPVLNTLCHVIPGYSSFSSFFTFSPSFGSRENEIKVLS